MNKATALSLVRLAAFTGTLCLASPAARAQGVPRLVADIEPDAQLDRSASRVSMQVVELGGRAFFQTDDGIHGLELWSTDGTAAGTWMVIDLCPGRCAGRPQDLTRVGDHIYFQGDNGVFGAELWRTDGTAPGTEMVADLREGLPGSAPSQLTATDSRLFFQANNGSQGRELWVTDGSRAGTHRLTETPIHPASPSASIKALGWVGSRFLFAAYDTAHGVELWASDGTPAGTGLLLDINAGAPGSMDPVESWFGPEASLGPGDRLYFAADDGKSGMELWASDGTVVGTHRVADLVARDGGSHPDRFCRLGNRLLFTAGPGGFGRGVWATDGTEAGTVLLLGEEGDAAGPHPLKLVAAGDRVFFVAPLRLAQPELWISDGTPEGTELVSSFPISQIYEALYSGTQMAALGDQVVFMAPDLGKGLEPWVSDGTAEGTLPLADINPGSGSSFRFPLFDWEFLRDELREVGGRIYFRAFDPTFGTELWSTDGTAVGTRRLLDINDQTSGFATASPSSALPWPPTLERVGPRLVALARNAEQGNELWVSNGTSDGTLQVAGWSSSAFDPRLLESASQGNRLLLSLFLSSSEFVTLSTDGTVESSFALTSGSPGPLLICEQLAARDGTAYCASTGAVWEIDHSTTHLLEDFGSPASQLEATESTVFFGLSAGASDELWGIRPQSTALLFSAGTLGNSPGDQASGTSLLYFKADDGANGLELWASDGTSLGTRRITSLQGTSSGLPLSEFEFQRNVVLNWPLVTVSDRAFFVADDGATGRELWLSDGTEVGTHRVADLNPAGSSDPQELTACGDRLCFVAFEPGSGRELWVSDGSTAGTRRVADLVAGPGSSLPQSLSWQDTRLYFSAWTPGLGREAWSWNGAEEPALVGDVATGPSSSSPTSFRWSAGQIFFVANDGTTGFELWSAPTATLFSDGFETGDLSGWSLSQP